MNGSPPGRLSVQDWRKIGKGLGIALAGSGLAYLGQQGIPLLEQTSLGYLAPLGAVLINITLKWLSDTRR